MLRSITILAVILSVLGCSTERALLYKMKTFEDYEMFAKKYPDSEHDDYAKNLVMKVLVKKLKKIKESKQISERNRKLAEQINKSPARDVQLSILRSYEVDVTTLQHFRADGWQSVDALIGKVGVVSFLINGANAEYTLGTHSMVLEKSNPDVLNNLNEYNILEAAAIDTPLTFSQDGQYSDFSHLGTTKKICDLTFKDKKLESKTAHFDNLYKLIST